MKMMNPVISLVIPVYGVRDYIEEFAVSVFSQSYPHVQYMFVNDGTKDDSMELLNALIDGRYPHLREKIVIVNKENEGLPAARRTGMDYVTGDYVWHVDPDDWISPGSLASIAARIEETGSDIIYFHYVKEYVGRSSVKKEKEYTMSERDTYIRNMYNHRAFGTLCNKCVRTGIYRENEIYFPQFPYGEDCFLSIQLVGHASSISMLDEVVYHYRKSNPHAITRQNRRRRREEYARNFLDLYEKYRDKSPDDSPAASVFDDILIQAGWFSIWYGLDLFTACPYLADAVSRAHIRTGTDVLVPAQILTKFIAFLKR